MLAQPRRAALLAYLALATPRVFHSRDRLLALFWPEYDADHARNALSQAVHFLRRSLGPDAIVTGSGDTLGLEWTGFWCDASAFEEALDAGRTAEAAELYRGDLLEGFHISSSDEFERWLEAERARYAARYARALELLAGEREQAHDFTGAAAFWRRSATRDPLSSRVALQLMRAFAAGGDPGAAVRHARVHETLLRDELGIAPDAEVTAFVQQLRSGQPAGERPATVSTSSAASSRIGATDFVDRARPLEIDVANGRKARPQRIAATLGLLVLIAVAGAAVLRGRQADPPLIRSIAVLPFEDLSADKTQGAFADGIHDELIEEVGRYSEVSITARTAVLQYRGTTTPRSEISRQLKVDGIVEGTVLREGGRVRMNVELVYGASGRHIWGRSYTRDLRDVLEMQREVAEGIARELRVATTPVSRVRRQASGARDSAPNELYLRQLYMQGRQDELSRNFAGMQTAREKFRAAIERDSTFAPAYAALAELYELMAFYDFARVPAALDSARMLARHAVALDSTLPEGHTTVALSLADARDFDAAEREFKRAIEFGPSNAEAHYWYTILLVALGRGGQALREADRGLELDPFPPRAALGMKRAALYLINGTRPHLKLPAADQQPILKLEPGEPWARAREATGFAEEGRCAEARSGILQARRLAPGDNIRMRMHLGTVDWLCGEPARARALLAEMKRRPDAADHGTAIAALHMRFGERDSALVWLEHQQRWTLLNLAFLSASGEGPLDSLRSDPRFLQLLRRVGIRK